METKTFSAFYLPDKDPARTCFYLEGNESGPAWDLTPGYDDADSEQLKSTQYSAEA